MMTITKHTIVRVAAVVMIGGAVLAATPPDRVHYSGVLRDAANDPQDGTFDMVFRFFDAEVGGAEVLVDQHLVTGTGGVVVTGGLFNVPLGGGIVEDGSGPGTYLTLGEVFRDYGSVWLEMQIGGETLSPRVRIEASPYALNAEHLDGLAAGQVLRSDATDTYAGGTLTVDAASTLRVDGEFNVQAGGPAGGKVLTSDSTGNATWQDLPAVQTDVLGSLSDRLGSSDASDLPFASLAPFACSRGGASSSLVGNLNGVTLTPGAVIVGFVGEERISRPFRYLVAIESSQADLVKVADQFDMELDLGDGSPPIGFPHGEVTEAAVADVTAGVYTYVIAVEPRLARLAKERRSRVFSDIKLSEVVSQVVSGLGEPFDGTASTFIYDQVVQYEESDLDFLNRICAVDGYHYHFDDIGAPKFRFGSDVTATPRVYSYYGSDGGPATTEFIGSFHPRDRDVTVTTTAAGWDPATKSRVSDSDTVDSSPLGNREARRFFGDLASSTSAGERAAAASAREQSRRFEVTGTGTASGLRAGHSFQVTDLTGTQEANGPYYVTHIVHYATQDSDGICVSYGNAFSALPNGQTAVSLGAVPFAPPLEPLTPVRGPVPAIVTDNNDVSGQGRIRVKLTPVSASEPFEIWARGTAPVGRWRDMQHLPEVDEEVLVTFLHDDPRAPVVLGSLYNGVDAPRPERRLHFRVGKTQLDPETQWLEWDDVAGRFEMDGASGIVPGLFVRGNLETAADLTATGNITGSGSLDVTGNIQGGADLNVPGTLDASVLRASSQLTGPLLNVTGPMTGGSTLTLPGPIVLNGGNLSHTTGTFSFAGNIDVSGTAAFGGRLDAAEIDLDNGARFFDTAGFARLTTAGDLDTDDLFLDGGNTADDGEIAIFGDSVIRFRAGNGTFNFFDASTGLQTAQLQPDGDLRIRGVLSEMVAFDIAESFLAGTSLEPGELVRLDPDAPGTVTRSQGADDGLVLGVVSTRPGLLLGGAPFDTEALRASWGGEVVTRYERERDAIRERVLRERPDLREELQRAGLPVGEDEGSADRVAIGDVAPMLGSTDEAAFTHERERLRLELESLCLERFHRRAFVPVALAGRVPVRADASFGAIRPGDRLAPSPVPGVAMRSNGTGPTIGIALEGLADGRGEVLLFVQRGGDAGATESVGAEVAASHDALDAPDGAAGPDGGIAGGSGARPAASTVLDPVVPFAVRGSDDERLMLVDENGDLSLRGAVLPASRDLAEYFPLSAPASAGDVLVVDRDEPGRYRPARSPRDPAVIGIVSSAPGVLLGAGVDRVEGADEKLQAELDRARRAGDADAEALAWARLKERFRETHAPVALSGTVPCKVDAGFGAIAPGDLLTTSPTAGHAMRASEAVPGTIVGKALEPLESGTGVIRVLVMLR